MKRMHGSWKCWGWNNRRLGWQSMLQCSCSLPVLRSGMSNSDWQLDCRAALPRIFHFTFYGFATLTSFPDVNTAAPSPRFFEAFSAWPAWEQIYFSSWGTSSTTLWMLWWPLSSPSWCIPTLEALIFKGDRDVFLGFQAPGSGDWGDWTPGGAESADPLLKSRWKWFSVTDSRHYCTLSAIGTVLCFRIRILEMTTAVPVSQAARYDSSGPMVCIRGWQARIGLALGVNQICKSHQD